MCRQLNKSAIKLKSEESDENQQDFDKIRNDLQDCLDRITEVAGKTEEDLSSSREYVQTLNS